MQTLARASGTSEDDLAHWLWILEAPDADARIRRFFSSDRPKPRFLLLAILRKDQEIIKQASLVKVYDYVAWMCQRQRFAPASPWWHLRNAVRNCVDLTPKFFALLLDRLLYHVMMRFPSSVVAIARLVVDYLRGIPLDHVPRKSNQRTGYASRCLIFNFAIQRFGRTYHASVKNMPHNWKAQRILLAFSATMKRPLVINQLSYTAIRMVLIGLKKAPSEQETAKRYSKKWPPFIRQLDGLDEAKDTEDYLSRSVRAGILKRQEGYPDDAFDRALDALGGAVLGESVTVQTRSKVPKVWGREDRRLLIFSDWSARVRATRNAWEAWQIFNEPPWHELKPNFQVYAEMFSKLYAEEVRPEARTFSGDGKEVNSPYFGNWTQIEREKMRPCSPNELYERMLGDGIRPVRECLYVLVKNAPSLARAATYLNDSPLDKGAVMQMTSYRDPKKEVLGRIPLPIFDAYLRVLCREQGRVYWQNYNPQRPPTELAYQKYDNVTRAIRLVTTRLGSTRKPAQEPWHTIMRALASSRLILRPYVTPAEDNLDALRRFLLLFEVYEATQTLDPFAFHCLCRCVRKAIGYVQSDAISSSDSEMFMTAINKMKTVFWELVTPVKVSNGSILDNLPRLFHEISSANVGIYIEVLGYLKQYDEAARVMEWVLASYGKEGILEKAQDPEHKQWQFMQHAFVCFRVFCDNDLPDYVIRRIGKRFEELQEAGSTWDWPSNEYVQEYIDSRGLQPSLAKVDEEEENDGDQVRF